MIGLSKCYRDPKILQHIKQVLKRSENIPKNGVVRFSGQSVLKRQNFCDSLKIKSFLRGSALAIRLSSNVSNKSKKVFELIFTRKGVVLIGILISIVTGYYIVLLSICVVLDEVIKKTVR